MADELRGIQAVVASRLAETMLLVAGWATFGGKGSGSAGIAHPGGPGLCLTDAAAESAEPEGGHGLPLADAAAGRHGFRLADAAPGSAGLVHPGGQGPRLADAAPGSAGLASPGVPGLRTPGVRPAGVTGASEGVAPTTPARPVVETGAPAGVAIVQDRRRRRHRANGPSKRPELVSEVFRLCETDGDGRLSLMELRTFAEGVGFEGTAEEWVEAYIVLCSANNVDPDRGFSKAMFARMVKDHSDHGVFWTDGELSAMISDLKTKASAPFLAELRVEQLAAAG